MLADLAVLRFLDEPQSAITLGPIGFGKTHRATALGHNAIHRRTTVGFARADPAEWLTMTADTIRQEFVGSVSMSFWQMRLSVSRSVAVSRVQNRCSI